MGYLDNQLAKVTQEIKDKKDQIKNLEDAHDTLVEFRRTVSASEGDFETASQSKKTVLKDLDSIKSKSNAAKRYQEGMSISLNNVGSKVVDAAFWGLDALIGLKLASYKTSINLAEADMLVLKARKKELETKIAIGDAIV